VAQTYLAPSRQIEIRYVQGDGDAKGWANPTPMPRFRTVPPATGVENQLRPEAEREAPPAPGPKVPAILPTPAESHLSNGIRVIAARTGETPLATSSPLGHLPFCRALRQTPRGGGETAVASCPARPWRAGRTHVTA